MDKNSWKYAKDKRTEEETEKCFKMGKANELIVFDSLDCPKFWIQREDRLGDLSPYKPECFLQLGGVWRPCEIKFTKIKLTYVELKQNQCDKLALINGVYLQACPDQYVILDTNQIKTKGLLTSNTYCNKPCYRVTPRWQPWSKQIKL